MKKETLLRPLATLAIAGTFSIAAIMDMLIILTHLCAFPAKWVVTRMADLTEKLLDYDIVLFTR